MSMEDHLTPDHMCLFRHVSAYITFSHKSNKCNTRTDTFVYKPSLNITLIELLMAIILSAPE